MQILYQVSHLEPSLIQFEKGPIMKFEDIEKVLHAKTTDIIGLKTVTSLSPLDHFDVYDYKLPLEGNIWVNLKVISSKEGYPNLYFSMTFIDGKYHLWEGHYEKYIKNDTTHYKSDNIDDAFHYIIKELQNHANPNDLHTVLEYEV